ncbi:MAG TPA: FeoB-associated Cys-rich membrane protein [Planctomicrobium sp.]|nr:FeoB-associated Cys-rich membrane protein [Planctomicrobium sp.]
MDWQTPLALICVLLAAIWLARPLWSKKRAGHGCSAGCGSCPVSKTSPVGNEFVSLGRFNGNQDANQKEQEPDRK